MSANQSLFPYVASGLTAFVLVAALFVSADFAAAAPATPDAAAPSCSCPDANKSARPKFARLPNLVPGPLGIADEVAALESVRFALTEVADGASYVWHRQNGRLSGVVQPVSSFKDANGAICRHIVVLLTSATNSRKAEGVACRKPDGVWELEG